MAMPNNIHRHPTSNHTLPKWHSVLPQWLLLRCLIIINMQMVYCQDGYIDYHQKVIMSYFLGLQNKMQQNLLQQWGHRHHDFAIEFLCITFNLAVYTYLTNRMTNSPSSPDPYIFPLWEKDYRHLSSLVT